MGRKTKIKAIKIFICQPDGMKREMLRMTLKDIRRHVKMSQIGVLFSAQLSNGDHLFLSAEVEEKINVKPS